MMPALGDVLGLREADGHLRHRLRDQAHLLAAPAEACQRIEQDQRRDHHGKQADQAEDAAAALAD